MSIFDAATFDNENHDATTLAIAMA